MFYSTHLQSSLLPAAARARVGVHELRAPLGSEACTGFAVLLLTALAGNAPILWASAAPHWYPPGLAWAGLNPARCLFAQARDDAGVLSALETALRGGMAGVGECERLSRLAAKRLALAARRGGSLGLVLRHVPARTMEDSTAFATRWLISPLPGTPEAPRVRAELLYARGAQPGVFIFELREKDDDTAPPVVAPMRSAG